MTTDGKEKALKLEKIYVKTKRITDKLERIIERGCLTDEMAETIRSLIITRKINEIIFYNGYEDIDVFKEETSNKNISTFNLPGDKYVEVVVTVLDGDYVPNTKSIKIYKRTDRLGKELDDVEKVGIHVNHDKCDFKRPIIAMVEYTVYIREQEAPNYEHAKMVGRWSDLHVYYPSKPFSTINEGEN